MRVPSVRIPGPEYSATARPASGTPTLNTPPGISTRRDSRSNCIASLGAPGVSTVHPIASWMHG